MSDHIKGRSDAAWRRNMGDHCQLLDMLAEALRLDAEAHYPPFKGISINGHTAENVVRRAAHLLRSSDAIVRAEDRHAWDQYAAASLFAFIRNNGVGDVADGAAWAADAMLGERRKRFARKDDDR